MRPMRMDLKNANRFTLLARMNRVTGYPLLQDEIGAAWPRFERPRNPSSRQTHLGKEKRSVSEAAEHLLERVVALGEEYPGGWVPDQALWLAANLTHGAYEDAVAELVKRVLAESRRTGAPDFPFLRATPEGRARARLRLLL